MGGKRGPDRGNHFPQAQEVTERVAGSQPHFCDAHTHTVHHHLFLLWLSRLALGSSPPPLPGEFGFLFQEQYELFPWLGIQIGGCCLGLFVFLVYVLKSLAFSPMRGCFLGQVLCLIMRTFNISHQSHPCFGLLLPVNPALGDYRNA